MGSEEEQQFASIVNKFMSNDNEVRSQAEVSILIFSFIRHFLQLPRVRFEFPILEFNTSNQPPRQLTTL